MKYKLNLYDKYLDIDIDQFKEAVEEALDTYNDFGGIPVVISSTNSYSYIPADPAFFVGYLNEIDYDNMIADINIADSPCGRFVKSIETSSISSSCKIYPRLIVGDKIRLIGFVII